MKVTNRTTCLIYGPPSPDMVLPFKFHPGDNEVPDKYWQFVTRHDNFKKDILDPKLVVPCETTEPDIRDQLAKLKDLSGFDLDGAKQAIELVDASGLLDRWLKAESRAEVKAMIVARVEQLKRR